MVEKTKNRPEVGENPFQNGEDEDSGEDQQDQFAHLLIDDEEEGVEAFLKVGNFAP
jgi:hypothetical protein